MPGRSLTESCAGPGWSAHVIGLQTFFSTLDDLVFHSAVLAGAIAGAGLFAGELARGTHVFALSQGTTRGSWWARNLAVCGLPVTVAVVGLAAAAQWSVHPFGALLITDDLRPGGFLSSATVPAVWTVVAFCAAASAGLLLRSTVRALAIGVLLAAILLLTTTELRLTLLPPQEARTTLLAGDPRVDRWLGPPGALPTSIGHVTSNGQMVSVSGQFNTPCLAGAADCVPPAGSITQVSSYQPAARYWTYQGVESVLLLVLAAAALGAGYVGLRREGHR